MNLERTIVENASEGILIVQNGMVEFYNPMMLTIAGYSDRDEFSLFFLDHVHPDDREIVAKRHQKRITKAECPPVYSFRIIRKDGDIRWVEINATITQWKGNPATLNFLTDITERKKAEEELTRYKNHLEELVRMRTEEITRSYEQLKQETQRRKEATIAERESEARYRQILETIEDAYFEVDRKGNITLCNHALSQLFGIPKEQLMGVNHVEYTKPETARKMYQVFNRVFTTGKPEKIMDYEIIRSDGSTRIVELSTSLVRDKNENPIGFRGIARDVTKRKQAEEALRLSEKKYRLLAENTSDLIETIDFSERYTYSSPAIIQLRGYTPEEALGQQLKDVLTKDSYAIVKQVLKEELEFEKEHPGIPRRSRTLELDVKHKDGAIVQTEVTTSFLRDENCNPTGILSITRDITERKKYENQLIFMAYHDPLTGLYNRKAFMEKLEESIRYAKRYGIKRAILFIDLDRFKQVNDTLGHECGDSLLVDVATRLGNSLRSTDYISRLGGDEFTVILNNPSGASSVKVAKNLIQALSMPYQVKDHIIDYITPSIGISVFPDDGHNVETLLKNADRAMYKAKELRNCCVLYNEMRQNAAT